MFDGRWPDMRRALRRYRLWMENAVALDELAHRGKRFNRWASLVLRSWAAARLWLEQPYLRQFEALTAVSSREQATRAADELARRPRHTDLAQANEPSHYESIATMAFDLGDIYHAVQLAIELQAWHSEHGAYPPESFSIRSAGPGLRYEPTADRRGYKIVGPRATLLERTAG